jgi:2-polyprenyl-3-methyl-5-hydroxy-6-metoxy-1,4-benzoquinol methylase
MVKNGWNGFWENQKESFGEIMRINTSHFASRVSKEFLLQSSNVLDYGCGPGFLADSLKSKGITFTGVDINPYYLEKAKIKHPESSFFAITTDPEKNAPLFIQHFKNEKFDFIVCLSIFQYFPSKEAVQQVIASLLPFLNSDGKVIIADIVDEKTSSWRDASALFYHCLIKNKLGLFVRFISYLLFSDYNKLSKDLALLKLSSDNISEISSNLNLNFKRMDGLTIHPTRTNYVLYPVKKLIFPSIKTVVT